MLRASSASPRAYLENLRRLLAGACHLPAPQTSETQRRPGVQLGHNMPPHVLTPAPSNSCQAKYTRGSLCPARRESPAWAPEMLLELCKWGPVAFVLGALPPQAQLCSCLPALQSRPGARSQ